MTKKQSLVITFDDLQHYTTKNLLSGKQIQDDVYGASFDRKGLKYVSCTIVLLDSLSLNYDNTLSTNIHKDDPDLDILMELLPTEILDELKKQL